MFRVESGEVENSRRIEFAAPLGLYQQQPQRPGPFQLDWSPKGHLGGIGILNDVKLVMMLLCGIPNKPGAGPLRDLVKIQCK